MKRQVRDENFEIWIDGDIISAAALAATAANCHAERVRVKAAPRKK